MQHSSAWADLAAELARWDASGRRALFWWRDDDAVAATPALDRLLDVRAGAPLALAVIPAGVQPDLIERVASSQSLTILQHGLAHENMATEGERKSEFPESRFHQKRDATLAALNTAREHLAMQFGDRFRPVLVPPWNRIAPAFASALPEVGFWGLSTYRARRPFDAAINVVDTHLDIINWRGSRGYAGDEAVLRPLVEMLAARRAGGASPAPHSGFGAGPIGLLTHHLDHDDGCWRFLAQFAELVSNHPAAAWCAPFEDEGLMV